MAHWLVGRCEAVCLSICSEAVLYETQFGAPQIALYEKPSPPPPAKGTNVNFQDMRLEQLGAHADAHYKAGEKANQRAMDQGKSAGLYLAEAKRRIDEATPYGQRTEAFEVFLRERCPSISVKGRARAYQLISIATGKTTEVEVADNRRARQAKQRSAAKEAKISVGDRKDRFQAPPEPDGRDAVMSTILAKLAKLSIHQLHAIERLIPVAHHRVVEKLSTAQLENWIRPAPG
ncbi:hypothetical protein [Mesorhizobium sp. M0053]|uniref:hypothetical protein n=1 Tax=Mesorhizobium sp. M0053 TaxID=2956864 RepID=UPI003336FD09